MLRQSIIIAFALASLLAAKAVSQPAAGSSEKRDSAEAQLRWAHEARIKATQGPTHTREEFLEAVRRYELVEKHFPQDIEVVASAKLNTAFVYVDALDKVEAGRKIALDLLPTPAVQDNPKNTELCSTVLRLADLTSGKISKETLDALLSQAKKDPAIANSVDLHRVYMACVTALKNNDPKTLEEAEEILANILLRGEGTLEELIIAKEILKQIPIYKVAIRERLRMKEQETEEWSRTGRLVLSGTHVNTSLAAGDRYSFSRILNLEEDPAAIEPFVVGQRQWLIAELNRFLKEVRAPEALEKPSFRTAVSAVRQIRALELRPELERILNIAVDDEQRVLIQDALDYIGKPVPEGK